MVLDERKRYILESIIKDYVETAEPVGSRSIVRKHGLNISAATVRNEMADLEDMGYLEQPHTSAGRIPSEMGFRYYVDCMMEKESLTDEEVEILGKKLQESIREWNDVAQGIGDFLSQVSNYASFIIIPSIKYSHFKYLHLVPIQEGQALVLVVTDVGLIMHRRIDIPRGISPEDLQAISEVFNRVCKGKKIMELRRSELQILRDDLKKRQQVIDRALEAVDNLLDNTADEKVLISGALNILKEPEFKDLDKLKRILTLLEEDGLFKGIIPDNISQDVDILIGKENQSEDIQEMSLVFTGYRTAGEMGKMGLIGPIRMEYWKAAGTLDSVRTIIEDLLHNRF
ncbi:Heat-inducible transcription repressor HrcA [Syntrophomonas zehnderi OL-4]|uniref:Heat-inducible transcription repressor HrcA n=1 Tax=Syntrophomonas zehnderi OL-4 TaxID=690567 RepID=A0A0E3W3Q7_9FIRM|nr:heat-inducible transcriptional repressor HrcA [Syntrophomonas zehnderi]CFX98826.1 Heat-inducible transcription repressor HrcA [Syntrophomonas zehnderi OL-4]